ARAVDLWRVGPGATFRNGRPDFVDDDLLPRADLALQPAGGDLLLPRHQRVPALLLDLVGHGIADRDRGSARNRLISEAAEAIDLGLFEPVEQIGKIRIGLAGKPDAVRGAHRQFGTVLAPLI